MTIISNILHYLLTVVANRRLYFLLRTNLICFLRKMFFQYFFKFKQEGPVCHYITVKKLFHPSSK